MRRPICSFDISSENTPTLNRADPPLRGCPSLPGRAMDSAMFIMKVVFPIEGLAARMIRSCG